MGGQKHSLCRGESEQRQECNEEEADQTLVGEIQVDRKLQWAGSIERCRREYSWFILGTLRKPGRPCIWSSGGKRERE